MTTATCTPDVRGPSVVEPAAEVSRPRGADSPGCQSDGKQECLPHEKPTASNRDAKGRFGPGNLGGPGNPFARQMAKFRTFIMNHNTPEHMTFAFTMLMKMIADENILALKLYFLYFLGKPAEMVDPDKLDIDEWQGYKETAGMVQESSALMQAPASDLPVTMVRIGKAARTQNMRDMAVHHLEHPEEIEQQKAEAARKKQEEVAKARKRLDEPAAAVHPGLPVPGATGEPPVPRIDTTGGTPVPPSPNGSNGQSQPSPNGSNGQSQPSANGSNGQGQPSANGSNGQSQPSIIGQPSPNGSNGSGRPSPNGPNGQSAQATSDEYSSAKPTDAREPSRNGGKRLTRKQRRALRRQAKGGGRPSINRGNGELAPSVNGGNGWLLSPAPAADPLAELARQRDLLR